SAYHEAVFGDAERERRYRDEVFAVTEKQLQEVAKRYLDVNTTAVGMLVPQKETEASSEEPPQPVDQRQKESSKKHPKPHSLGEVERWTLANGVRIVFRYVPGMRISSMYASALGGLWSESPENNGTSYLTSLTVDRGTTSRSDERIAEE